MLAGISLDQEITAVLLGRNSPHPAIYELMLAQENAQWEKIAQLSGGFGCAEVFIAECHWKAMQWARQMTSSIPTDS